MMQQMKDLNTRVEAVKEVAAKAAAQSGGSAQSGDAELEALRQLPLEELGERDYALHNTVKGVFAFLSDRYIMIQLRASMESEATVHGGTEALRAKLAFIEEKVYAGTDGLVTDGVLSKWLNEFDAQKAAQKAKAVMTTYAKASAKVLAFRDRPPGAGKAGDAGKVIGGRGNGKGCKGTGSGRGAQAQT
ncbi:hypothetical protein CYMTET_53091 [Cymbomonas tetramitiformis]|uniref:Uncharacterized protein n=1 Tax=Cymbomonas tetramitiformis TaxID=36881 RepID=A0AAE0BJI5_9CHLO|nr:hypothetical protein CYMTET_53091 [Cymbomonas tetramitiformis]